MTLVLAIESNPMVAWTDVGSKVAIVVKYILYNIGRWMSAAGSTIHRYKLHDRSQLTFLYVEVEFLLVRAL